MTIAPELITFLEQGVSMHIGTRNGRLEPHGARVIAVRVEPPVDGHSRLTAFVPVVDAAEVVADLEANGQAALAFVRPSDDRACQVKGVCVSVQPADPADAALVSAQWNSLLSQLELVGIPREASRQWAVWPCVAIALKVTAIFDQTPGPGAGAALDGSGAPA